MRKRCKLCFEKIHHGATLFQLFLWKDCLCPSCRRKFKIQKRKFEIKNIKGVGLYEYNEFFSETLVQYKECMDEALAPIFLLKHRVQLFFRYYGYTLVPMPSSSEKRAQRGFCHVTQMTHPIGLPLVDCLEKKGNQKQVFSSFSQRLEMKENIGLKKGVKIPRKVLLVDDVCTTGSTLKGAIQALKSTQCKMSILVISLAMKPKDKE